jgi:hypothetical protein
MDMKRRDRCKKLETLYFLTAFLLTFSQLESQRIHIFICINTYLPILRKFDCIQSLKHGEKL